MWWFHPNLAPCQDEPHWLPVRREGSDVRSALALLQQELAWSWPTAAPRCTISRAGLVQ
jgi:hypothetical protein